MKPLEMNKIVDGLSREEISRMYQLLKQRAKDLDAEAMVGGDLRRGRKVQFKPSQRRFGGRTLSGVVDGMRGRKVIVRTPDGSWRVPPSMLTVVL